MGSIIRSIRNIDVHEMYVYDSYIDVCINLIESTRRLNIVGVGCSGRHTLAENICFELLGKNKYNDVYVCNCCDASELPELFNRASSDEIKGALVIILEDIKTIIKPHELFRSMPKNVYIIAISDPDTYKSSSNSGWFISIDIAPLLHNMNETLNLLVDKDFMDVNDLAILTLSMSVLMTLEAYCMMSYGCVFNIASEALVKAIDDSDAGLFKKVFVFTCSTTLESVKTDIYSSGNDTKTFNELKDGLSELMMLLETDNEDRDTEEMSKTFDKIGKQLESAADKLKEKF